MVCLYTVPGAKCGGQILFRKVGWRTYASTAAPCYFALIRGETKGCFCRYKEYECTYDAVLIGHAHGSTPKSLVHRPDLSDRGAGDGNPTESQDTSSYDFETKNVKDRTKQNAATVEPNINRAQNSHVDSLIKSHFSGLNIVEFPSFAGTGSPRPTAISSVCSISLENFPPTTYLQEALQLGWALILSHCTRSNDVLFGTKVFGDFGGASPTPGTSCQRANVTTSPIFNYQNQLDVYFDPLFPDSEDFGKSSTRISSNPTSPQPSLVVMCKRESENNILCRAHIVSRILSSNGDQTIGEVEYTSPQGLAQKGTNSGELLTTRGIDKSKILSTTDEASTHIQHIKEHFSGTLPSTGTNCAFIVATAFAVDPITVDMEQNFMRIGGDSLMAIDLSELAKFLKHDTSIASESFPFERFKETERLADAVAIAIEQCNVSKDQIEDIYPTTDFQAGFMFKNIFNPGMYAGRFVYHLPSDIDLDRFQRAWTTTVNTALILRSRLMQASQGQVLQVVIDHLPEWTTYPTLDSLPGQEFGKPLLYLSTAGTRDRTVLIVTCISPSKCIIRYMMASLSRLSLSKFKLHTKAGTWLNQSSLLL
ncbi:hypothetical protein BDZ45DRAFT_744602 [Acephala macrosclerotiorum]|nr:hypothetical protein BDZ45DRAFT_744602 [Acephala macrosclerotiorum]